MKIKVVAVCLLIMFVTNISFAQAKVNSASTQDAAEREIRALTRAWDEAMVKRDVAVIDRTLSDDYLISGTDKPSYLALVKSPQIEYKSVEREISSVRVYDNAAVSLGRIVLSGTSTATGGFASSFSFMDVWIKQQNRWRCVATKAEEVVQTYEGQKTVRFGPDVKASLVILFKPEITNEQVENFRREVLQTTNQNGRRYLAGIQQYLRVLPIQNHEAVALTFHDDIAIQQREDIMKRIKSSSQVYKVFENTAPNEVKLNQ